MKRKLWLIPKMLCLVILPLLCLLNGCDAEQENTGRKEQKEAAAKSGQPIAYSSVTIPVDRNSKGNFLYNPVDHALTRITKNKHTYTSSTWQSEKGWTSRAASWKIKKNDTLENFTFNTNGALYACRKTRKKGKLIRQTLVHLRSKGRMQKVNLIDLNHLASTSPNKISEIMDLQCYGTSIAVTYQYGAVKIYNLAEGQALGASSITGTPQKNVFYDLHYITIERSRDAKNILLHDYDIRSGEISHTFPLGDPRQNETAFHVSNCQNDLYVLTNRGLFGGHCSDTSLNKLLTYSDLKLPDQSQITYFQAGKGGTLYLGYQTKEGNLVLRFLTLPESILQKLSPEQKDKTTAPV